jgi:hypothetical protein
MAWAILPPENGNAAWAGAGIGKIGAGELVYVPRRISSRHVKRFGNGWVHNQEAFTQNPGKASEDTLPAVTISSV